VLKLLGEETGVIFNAYVVKCISPLDGGVLSSPVVCVVASLVLERRNRICTFQQLVEEIHIMQTRILHLFSKLYTDSSSST
jgi:hypothetical protein